MRFFGHETDNSPWLVSVLVHASTFKRVLTSAYSAVIGRMMRQRQQLDHALTSRIALDRQLRSVFAAYSCGDLSSAGFIFSPVVAVSEGDVSAAMAPSVGITAGAAIRGSRLASGRAYPGCLLVGGVAKAPMTAVVQPVIKHGR